MSLFSSLMRDMESDPIFGAHHRAMNRMMNSFFGGAGPAGGGFGLSLMGHPHPHPHPHHVEERDDMMPFGGAMTPFGAFGGFPDMSRMMNMVEPGNNHAFSSSSFVSYSSGHDGRPQVYQASSETRQGPNGLKETRKTLTDSRSGTKKMAVGRHMGDRSHVVEREQNLQTGQLNENHEFYNLDEVEAPQFDRDWRHQAHHHHGRYAHSASMPAIASSAAPTAEYVQDPDDYAAIGGSSSNGCQPRHSESAVTIEELPPSDDEAEQSRARRSYPHASSSSTSSSRRSPYGASKEKRQKRSKTGKKY